MHPTRISKNVIQQLESLSQSARAGDAGRYAALREKLLSRYSLEVLSGHHSKDNIDITGQAI